MLKARVILIARRNRIQAPSQAGIGVGLGSLSRVWFWPRRWLPRHEKMKLWQRYYGETKVLLLPRVRGALSLVAFPDWLALPKNGLRETTEAAGF